MNPETLIGNAVRYAKNGYRLVPCSIGVQDGRKKASFLVSSWRTATELDHLDENQIRHWVGTKKANAFLGVHPDTVAVDFDSPDALTKGRRWLKEIGKDPRVIVRTGKGQHWIFLNDGSLTNKQHLKNIDVQVGRANGGVFIAGSWHPVAEMHYEIIHTDTEADSVIGQGEINALKRICGSDEASDAHSSDRSENEVLVEADKKTAESAKKRRFSMKMIDEADWSEGARNATLNLMSFKAVRIGRADLLNYCRIKALEAGLGEDEITATQESAKKGAIAKLLEEPTFEIDFEYEWQPLTPFTTDDAYTLRHVFSTNQIKARFNLRSRRIELKLQNDDWTPADDRKAKQIATEIARSYTTRTPSGVLKPLRYSLNAFLEELLAIVAGNEADPFIDDFLEKLPDWDGIERIDFVLTDLFDTPADEINAWASRYPFIASIQRAYKPGCKLDEMPVYFGRQGIGKSSFLSLALPDELATKHDLFTDQVDFQARHRELIETITGRVIVECQEMRGATKTDHAKIKAFLTSRNDNSVRMAYARFPESRPRRCIFVGTTDRPDALPNDPAGNRRFVFIRLGSKSAPVEKYFSELTGESDTRSQLWAEALEKYRKGLRANLPRNLYAVQKEINEQHRSSNEVVEDVIEKHLELLLEFSDYVRASELYKKCADEISHIKEYQIRNYLQLSGFESVRKKEDGKIVRAWQRNPNPNPEP